MVAPRNKKTTGSSFTLFNSISSGEAIPYLIIFLRQPKEEFSIPVGLAGKTVIHPHFLRKKKAEKSFMRSSTFSRR